MVKEVIELNITLILLGFAFAFGLLLGGLAVRLKLELMFRSVQQASKELAKLQRDVKDQLAQLEKMREIKQRVEKLVKEVEEEKRR